MSRSPLNIRGSTGLQFRLAKEDTTRPFLTSVTALDRYHLTVRFSEPVDTLSIVPRNLLASSTP